MTNTDETSGTVAAASFRTDMADELVQLWLLAKGQTIATAQERRRLALSHAGRLPRTG